MTSFERFKIAVLSVAAASTLPAAGLSVLTLSGQALGQSFPAGNVRVQGNQRIEAETITSYLTFQPGQTISLGDVDRSLKALYATGLFADVKIAQDGRDLLINVVENPIINRVAFEGNSKLTKENLEKEVQVKPRVIYTRSRVQADVQRIIELYRRSGRFSATIEPKVVQLPQNRVDLIFEINEGSISGIRKINFIGNKSYSNTRLKEEIATKESTWWRFLSSSDNYDPDRLAYDRELLRRFYLNRGYADFRVVSGVAELTRDREDFFVTFTMDEGPTYEFGKIDVTTQLKALDPKILKDLVPLDEGDLYSADRIDKTIELLTAAAGRQGYAFVDISPKISRDRTKRRISVTFEVNEGPRVYVDRINITGNTRTIDKVIRREFRLAENDAYNAARIERTKTRLKALQYFEKVEINQEPGSAPDRTNLNVELTEKATGSLNIGLAYSSTEKLLGDISISDNNFLGRGQIYNIGAQLSSLRRSINFGYTDPYFLDKNLAAGINLYTTRTNYQSIASYDQQALGTGLSVGFELSEFWRMTLRYVIREDKVFNVPSYASNAIKSAEGSYVTSLIGYNISWDRRDDAQKPRNGWLFTFSQDVAGLGGSVNYLRQELTEAFYYPITDTITGIIRGEQGYIKGLGQNVRITDRFFLGGDNLRGFKLAGIGPRDVDYGDALGGNIFATATAEVTFPLGLPAEFGVKGAAFTDIGTLFQTDSFVPNLFDRKSPRAASGVGVNWDSPFGPIRVDIAKAWLKGRYDQAQTVRFNVGTRF
jgi:outer membrane protein insertion porin family